MPRVGIVARDLLQAGVDDGGDVRDGHRRLRDVGRDDDPPPGRRGEARDPARLRIERSVQRHDSATRRHAPAWRSSTARRISAAPGRKQRTPPGRAPAARAPRRRPAASARYETSSGNTRPGTSMIGQPPRNADDRRRSSVADMTTIRRSSRASHACLASASARSAWTLRSWNSSRTMVRKSESSGSLLQARGQNAFGRHEQTRVAR